MVVALAGASACTGSSMSEPGEHTGAVLDRYEPERNMSIIDTLLYGSSSGAFELEVAGYDAMSRCVEAAGFEWHAVRPTPALIQADMVPILEPLDLDEARTNGYGLSNGSRQDIAIAATEQFDEYRDSLDVAATGAFDATAADCRTQTNEMLPADLDGYGAIRQQVDALRFDMADRVAASDEARSLNEEWSACMEAAGYMIASPLEATREVRDLSAIRSQPLRDVEIEVATADARCRSATSYQDRLLTVYYDHETSLIHDNEVLILELVELRYKNQTLTRRTTMRRTSIIKLGLAAGLVAGLGIPGQHASAASAYATCPSNRICVHDGANGGDGTWSASAADYDLGSGNNKASSVSNKKAANRARYYRNQDYGGNSICASAAAFQSWKVKMTGGTPPISGL